MGDSSIGFCMHVFRRTVTATGQLCVPLEPVPALPPGRGGTTRLHYRPITAVRFLFVKHL